MADLRRPTKSILSSIPQAIPQGFLLFALILLIPPSLEPEAQSQADYRYDVNAQVALPELYLPSLSIPVPHLSFDADISAEDMRNYIAQQQAMIMFRARYSQINSAARGWRGYRATSFGPKPYLQGNLFHQPSEAIRYRYGELNAKAGSGARLGTPGGTTSGH